MKILFITHKAERCGVADYGKRLFAILAPHMDITLCETDGEINYEGYDIALYNYHYATLPFVKQEPGIKQVILFHEAFQNFTPDVLIPVESLPRPLFENIPYNEFSYKEGSICFDEIGNVTKIKKIVFDEWNPALGDIYISICETGYYGNMQVPIIGSFGFGFPDKNFPGLCRMVKDQFDKAIIRLNIPFAQYGDNDGDNARIQVRLCKAFLEGSNIQLEVNHDFLSQSDLLKWLSCNDINLFLYKDSHGRGLSSATDYALSVQKPIGISSSEMFRHLPRSICIDNTCIGGLIAQGIEPLKKVYEDNSNEKLVSKIKSLLYG